MPPVRHLAASKSFQRQLRKLPQHEQQKAVAVLKEFLTFLHAGAIPSGYGFKKINGDKYELRVGLRLRIVMKADGDSLVCHVIGDHDDIRRHLRQFRHK